MTLTIILSNQDKTDPLNYFNNASEDAYEFFAYGILRGLKNNWAGSHSMTLFLNRELGAISTEVSTVVLDLMFTYRAATMPKFLTVSQAKRMARA